MRPLRPLQTMIVCSTLAALSAAAQAQEGAPLPQLHVLAVGVDAAGTNVTSILPTQLGIDTRAFARSLQDANIVDVHTLINEANQRSGALGSDPYDLELDRMERSVAPQDTLLVAVAARVYMKDGQTFADLDKYGVDIPLAHRMVRLRRMPCANIVLVLPGLMTTAMEINLHHYVEAFPVGVGAAKLDLISTTSLSTGGLHTPLLAALARGLRGDADANHDGLITASEVNEYLDSQAIKSQPDALQKLDPYYHNTSGWGVTEGLYKADFTVVARLAQARIAGEAETPAAVAPGALRGPTVVKAEAVPAVSISLPKTYAVLFATDHYDAWPPLTNPIQDAKALQVVLRDTYGVDTELVPDASADDVVKVLQRYVAKHYEDNAQLVVFFAGHGYFAEDVRVGYLATRESKLPAADPTHRSLLSFDDIQRYVGRIPAKHVLLVMDSCFSGALDRKIAEGATRDDGNDKIYAPRPLAQVISLQTKYPTRRFITSGGKEYVPDGRAGEHSPFTRALLQTLARDADEHGYARLRDVQAGLEAVQPAPHWGSLDEQDDLNGDLILLTPAMRTKLLTAKGAGH